MIETTTTTTMNTLLLGLIPAIFICWGIYHCTTYLLSEVEEKVENKLPELNAINNDNLLATSDSISGINSTSDSFSGISFSPESNVHETFSPQLTGPYTRSTDSFVDILSTKDNTLFITNKLLNHANPDIKAEAMILKELFDQNQNTEL